MLCKVCTMPINQQFLKFLQGKNVESVRVVGAISPESHHDTDDIFGDVDRIADDLLLVIKMDIYESTNIELPRGACNGFDLY